MVSIKKRLSIETLYLTGLDGILLNKSLQILGKLLLVFSKNSDAFCKKSLLVYCTPNSMNRAALALRRPKIGLSGPFEKQEP